MTRASLYLIFWKCSRVKLNTRAEITKMYIILKKTGILESGMIFRNTNQRGNIYYIVYHPPGKFCYGEGMICYVVNPPPGMIYYIVEYPGGRSAM